MGADVLPAHAGVILTWSSLSGLKTSITRTCGGDPGLLGLGFIEKWYYPHMRG